MDACAAAADALEISAGSFGLGKKGFQVKDCFQGTLLEDLSRGECIMGSNMGKKHIMLES